ncbi:hypothetical protein SAY86_024870 [Trapa natans]|uniref:RING-type E3 ubiquitin transferase n=1 Tax=Trapa natans TaxID=22666 RepID=A0AAN7REN4_TRANT|nr:hypothetical protein SAY86_024870 [Trapa natans]
METEDHLSSAVAFVQGGIQEACDDACSICLEDFCESDPSTVTSCKHEFHLQCILEWCQRSSQCPMCWQPIHLKDPTSQELLEAVERERNIRLAPPQHATIFHHPTLGDFELQHLPVGATDSDLEERIIQHLAAAAAMGRARHHLGRRDGHSRRSSGHNHPHFVVLSTHNGMDASPISGSAGQLGDDPEEPPGVPVSSMSTISSSGEETSRQISVQDNQITSSTSEATVVSPADRQGNALINRSTAGSPSSPVQNRAGPSDFQSFSESLKSKWNAVSMRYKESISKSTRGWRVKFFSSNTSMAGLIPEVRREESEGINRITHRVGCPEATRAIIASESSDDHPSGSVLNRANQRLTENQGDVPLGDEDSRAAASSPSH